MTLTPFGVLMTVDGGVLLGTRSKISDLISVR
jgi:hypothetical protein